MTNVYFFKSNGLTKKDQVKMTKVGTNMLSDTAKRRQKDGNETATSDKVIIRTSLGHFLRYVAMIVAVLTLSIANIGTAWGAETELFSSFSNSTKGNYFKEYTVDSKTVTVSTPLSISSSSGDYFVSLGSTPSNNASNYIELSVSGATIKTVSVKITGNGADKTCQPALLGWEGAVASNTTADYVLVPASVAVSAKGVSNAVWHQFDVHGNDLTRVRIYRAVKGVNVAGGSTSGTTYGNAQTLQFYGIRVELEVDGVTKPTFSPATGSSLVKSTGTVALTSSGNTVYYKWSQTDNQYASGAGATLAGTADGSGPSPVNATAPSTAGTWYLYAVAKNGGDYSDVVKATYTITNPTHTLTWNLDGGTATGGTAAGAVAEGATLTAPTVTKVGYDFAGWSPAVPATMPAADATYTATWTKVYASGTYNFYNNATLGTSPNQKTITTSYADYDAFRIDNIFFSAVNMAYESGSTATGSDYAGWKIKKNNATIKFFVENDSEVTISVGRDNTLNVSYTNTAGASQTPTISSGNSSTYSVKGGTMVTLTMSTSSTITIKQIAIAPIASCTAPSSVGITGTNKYLGGQTISLTATPVGGSGTATYQWQKEINSVWTNLENGGNISGATSANLQISSCGHGNSGQYRCVVSTGATCSTNSSAYGVHVFSIYGKYYSGEYSHNEITWTSGTTGTATIHLNASSTYLFKVWSNDGYYYGNGSNNYIIQPVNWDCGTGNDEMRLLTGPEGDYTFTVNIEHGLDGSPYVNVQVGYPSVSHPSTGYMYITKWWDHCYVHYWEGTNNALSPWGYDPEINSDRYVEICGTNYWYFPVIDTYNKLIAKDAAGDPSNTTGDQVSTSNGGRYITHDGSWGWHDFSTYTITYAANGGGGSMTATSGICPDANQAITSNAFTAPSGCASFGHWTANVNVKVGGNTITAGDPIANGVTIQNINSNITLTAVWKLATPTITDNGDNTFSISGSMAGSSYYYTTNNSTPTTSSSLYSSAVDFSAGEANITAKAIAHKDGYVDSDVASQACTYHAPAGDEHVYYYKDATHYVSSSYKNPEGGTPSGTDNVALTTPWTIRNNTFMTGLTSVVATAARYDNKGSHMNAYIKLRQTDGGKIVFTIASGYTATIKIKMGGYSGANTNLTMKLNDSGDNITYSGTMSGAGTTEDDYAQLTYADLAAGAYTLKPTSGSLYISQIDIETEAVAACTAAPTVTAGSNSSVGSTTATVSCASGISSLGTGGCTITEYGFVIGTSADPVIGGSGVTKHVVGTTYTTTGTSFSKNLTGLTASTTYYVRPYATNGYGTGYGTQTSFTTAAAEPEALIHWIVTVDASTWSLNGSPTTTDGTNITSISSSIDAASSPSTGASGTTAKVSLASASDNVDKAASFTFTVNSAKKVEPERVTCQVFNVGGSSGGQLSYKAQLSDNNGHIYYSTNTVVPASEATLTDATFTFASDLVLTGNVTIKVYGWKSGSAGSAFRMGADVKLFGEVQNAADYTVTHTLSNVTKSAGATSVKEGNNYTATYAGAGGYALPSTITVTIGGSPATAGTDYTWTQGTGVVSIPGNKVTGNIVITVTGVAVVNYSITYHCNGAESGCPSDVAATTNLPSPLPTGMTKDGYDFGGWFTDSECTVAAVAGAALTGNTDLYAKWTVHSASECITIAYFETTSHNNSSSKPDNAGKYIYGYTNSAKTEAYAYTITSSTGDNKGQGTGESDYLRMNYGTTVTIYADNTTTGGTPASFSNVTSVSVDFKMMKSTYYTSFDIYVGSTKIANNVSLEGAAQSAFTTFTYDNLEQLSGTVRIVNKGSGSSNFHFYVDNIVICTASMSSCTTPTLPTATLSNQTVCEGSDIAAWDATPTNAAAIEAAGESISYSWKKKGNDTELVTTATFDLGASAAESQAGTYVVTVTVSKAGYSSASATKEVTLSVTDGIEVTGITADKATVYPTNSVTLTATASADATWQWYTCASAEGAGAAIISGAESASYTIASAGVAGTYYYKAVATGDCGTAEAVYTLVVSPAAGGDCFHFVSVIPASDFNASSGASLVTPTHATTLEGGTMKVGSQQVTFTRDYGLKMESSKTVSITLDAALEAGNVVIVKGTSGTKGYGITINGVNFYDADNKTFDVSYTVVADDGLEGQTALTVSKYSGSSYLQEVKITGCGESCTDPEVTASVSSSTACEGSSVTFTASDAHASATYQWQKLDGTWTNISGATASTYNIASVVAGDAGKYRVIATHDCNRTSNEVTLSVPSAPDFGSTVPASVSVMQTLALSINTVEATDAVNYIWYKSADPTWDAGDVEIGTNKELIKAYDGEAIGSPSYYIFCRAQNACDITTSTAIAVNVTTYVEEDCATRGNESDAAFSFENSGAGQGSYESTACWTMNSNSKILVYYPPTGKYFKTAKVTIASSSESKASYNWSTNGGTSFTAVSLTVSSTLTERTINLSTHGNVDAFQIGRNFDSKGSSGGTLYVSKICFEYTDACTATTVTPSTASKTHTIGDAFTAPTFTLAPAAVSGGTLSYSSSDEDIASVDSETGAVTFNGRAGEVTITASYAGATISETDYCASEGSYTITVSCAGGAPKIVADGSVNMSGCNTSVTLNAKQSDGTTDFTGGSYQWFRNGEEIDDATSKSITVTQSGTYTVEYTSAGGCTSLSSNSATVTSESTEPEIERLTPFQYYHVDSVYHESSIMRYRHLFTVKNSAEYNSTGKKFKMELSRNGAAATDVTAQSSIVVTHNGDNTVDTVLLDLNALRGKYSEGDELVLTCKAVDCAGNVSESYKDDITVYVIDNTPTLALICSGSSKAGGTRKTGELTVGGDFLTGYNVADLCQQTGNTSFDKDTEWGLYTDLKARYKVTPVNGYAVFNKLNYEPFDVLLLTDYPKASKSDAAATILDDMADLCDYRPMLSFKTHMVAKSPSKWAEKGFTTSPVVTKADGKLNLNIVCYAHPMFESLKTGEDVYTDVGNTSAPLVYTMLSGAGYESSKGMQGFELAAAENFVTIGLTHYNATIAKNSPLAGEVEWTPGSEDRMLVTVAERQANPEARFILFSLNCGAQSKLTDKGEQVVLACLNYLLGTAEGTIEPADCSFTFDNGENNEHDDAWYEDPSHCDGCTGTKGDGKWTTAANWGPDYRLLPGEFTSVRIKKPVEVDDTHAHVMEVRIIDEGSIDIPAGKALDVKSTIRRMDGSEIYPTEIGDIHIGSASTGNGTLIFNNDEGDTKARVDMYSNAKADMVNMSAATSTWQYIGTPHNDVASATRNYYDSWLYQYSGSGWEVIPNGGPLVPFRGYCVTHPAAPVVFDMVGTLVATTSQDIAIPAGYTVIANSWTAPIDISTFTDDDMENISDKTIYFFNTGSDAEGNHGTGTEAGTYVAVPKNSASYVETWQIPSMQGFYISTENAGTLHLDYERHVRPAGDRTIVSNPMYAPRRAAAESDEPNVLKIFARGSRYQDKLVVLEREDFTRGYDSGWDGEAWGGGTLSPMVYVTGDGREDAVSAIPEFEGTVVAFKAGEDDAYTLYFEYLNSDEPLYLYDVEANVYTQIMNGNAYYFTATDKAAHSRFILTRKNPQVTTGVEEPTSDSSLKGRARKLLIEDKLFIMINGLLYDATGKVVK